MSEIFFSIAALLKMEFKGNFILPVYCTRCTHFLCFLALSNLMSAKIKIPPRFCVPLILIIYVVLTFCISTALALYNDKVNHSEIQVYSFIVG